MITEAIMKVLDAFHHRISRKIMGNTAWSVREEVWEFTPEEEVVEAAGMYPMQAYVRRK